MAILLRLIPARVIHGLRSFQVGNQAPQSYGLAEKQT